MVHACASHAVLILTVLIIQPSFTCCEQSRKPMNAVSIVGDRIKMECSSRPNSSLPVDWEFTSVGSSDVVSIYTVGEITESLSSRYKIDTDGKTRYDIVIDSVDFFHAGRYKCTPITEAIISAATYSAELIVLASDPICTTNASTMDNSILEGDYIHVWCAVNYSGNWIPVTEFTNTVNTVTTSSTIQLNSTDNGITFTFKTSFKPSAIFDQTARRGETPATNIPHYRYFWNFKANVLYGPRNLTVEPIRVIYEVGDRLICSADGNPSPTYQWTETGTNRVSDGPILILDETMSLSQILTFKCTATNTLAGENKEVTDFVTFVVAATSATPDSTSAATIALTIVVVIAVIALLVLVLGVALTVKACTKGNSINLISSNELSVQQQSHEIASEPIAQHGNSSRSVDPLSSTDSSTLQQDLGTICEDPGQSINPRISDDSSTSHYDYEIVDEPSVRFEDAPPPHQSSSNEENTENHSEEIVAFDGYSSLHRDASAAIAQPSVYTKLHQYANVNSKETNQTTTE